MKIILSLFALFFQFSTIISSSSSSSSSSYYYEYVEEEESYTTTASVTSMSEAAKSSTTDYSMFSDDSYESEVKNLFCDSDAITAASDDFVKYFNQGKIRKAMKHFTSSTISQMPQQSGRPTIAKDTQILLEEIRSEGNHMKWVSRNHVCYSDMEFCEWGTLEISNLTIKRKTKTFTVFCGKMKMKDGGRSFPQYVYTDLGDNNLYCQPGWTGPSCDIQLEE